MFLTGSFAVLSGAAPVGYTNNSKTRGIDVDSDKAPKVKKIFEMYATGEYPLNFLANWCEKKKLLTIHWALISGKLRTLPGVVYSYPFFRIWRYVSVVIAEARFGYVDKPSHIIFIL